MRGLKFLPLVLAASLIWFLWVSEKGSQWLAGLATRHEHSDLVVGRIVSANGGFKRIHGGGVDDFSGPLSAPLPIQNGDRIETNKGAQAVLVLQSQDELELGELSSLSLQLWNEKDANSPIYMMLSAGDVTAKKTGLRGKAYIVRAGRLYFPGQKASDKPMALTVLRSAPLDMELADQNAEGSDVAEFDPDHSSRDDEGEDTPKVDAGREPETLANEYIDEMINSRQSQLQKCWLSRLKENPGLRGQMILQFGISRRGKVRDLRVSDATFDDEALKRCVMSVIERISFRSYRGQEISLSYPINFE